MSKDILSDKSVSSFLISEVSVDSDSDDGYNDGSPGPKYHLIVESFHNFGGRIITFSSAFTLTCITTAISYNFKSSV